MKMKITHNFQLHQNNQQQMDNNDIMYRAGNATNQQSHISHTRHL